MDRKARTATILLLGSVLVLGSVPLALLALAPGAAGYAALGAAVLVLGDLPTPQPVWFAVGALLVLAGARFVHTRRMA